MLTHVDHAITCRADELHASRQRPGRGRYCLPAGHSHSGQHSHCAIRV